MGYKIAFIGAGSIGFTRKLVKDMLSVPEFTDLEFVFMDISEANLDMVYRLIERDVQANGLTDITLSKTTDQKKAVENAKYVIKPTIKSPNAWMAYVALVHACTRKQRTHRVVPCPTYPYIYVTVGSGSRREYAWGRVRPRPECQACGLARPPPRG